MFTNAKFIEFPEVFDPAYKTHNPAPVFKKTFSVVGAPHSAVLSVCALGLGYIYLNGNPITPDLFTAPISDYRKTLWFNQYDISSLLKEGENEITAILGNGFYNESLKTGWDFDTAEWRGNPKLLLQCDISTDKGDLCVATDESWRCSKEISPILFNELRSGETYDCRIGENFLTAGSEDWAQAIISPNPPTGVLRQCMCQPIREFERYRPIRVIENKLGRTVYDFGQNLSGYAEITLKGTAGQRVTLRHAERIHEDGTLNQNEMDGHPFYQGPEFQTNRIILSGQIDTIKPRFTYHGFRYIEIDGATSDQVLSICSVFVHQAVDTTAAFECSNDTVNRIYECAKMSVWSNLFYTLTDCPTREKLGWGNDAIASLEQIYLNFDIHAFLTKWLQDVLDAQTPDGEVPSIIPTWGWGLEENTSCIGPLCSNIICELPMAMYEATGDLTPLRAAYPAMLRHVQWLQKKADQEGMYAYGLGDWAGPFHYKHPPAPLQYVTTAQVITLLSQILRTSRLLGEENREIQNMYRTLYDKFFGTYYDARADRCKVDSQSAVAMMINIKEDGATPGLKEQLREAVLAKDCHHNCGMVSMRHLYTALDRCDLNDLAYNIVNAEGNPSYKEWLEDGATTLYEMWNTGKSNNHHMNSCVVAWIIKALLGIHRKPGSIGYKDLVIHPFFPEDMDCCKGHIATAAVQWTKEKENVLYKITLNEGVSAQVIPPQGYMLEGPSLLTSGEHTLLFKR